MSGVLAKTSFDTWAPLDEVGGLDAIRDVINLVTPDTARQDQLFRLVFDVIYLRANISVDYARALPALVVSGSMCGALPMARVTMESIAVLDWHSDPGLSTEERILRIFRDAHETWKKVAGRTEKLLTSEAARDAPKELPEYYRRRMKSLIDASSSEIAAVGQIVKASHGKTKFRSSNRFPDAPVIVNEAIERMLRDYAEFDKPLPTSVYHDLSDSVHGDPLIMQTMLRQANFDDVTRSSIDIITVDRLLVPIWTALAMMCDTFRRMNSFWQLNFPFEAANECCWLMAENTGRHGNETIYLV